MTKTNSKITAIILAGGKSSRMGQDKAMLPVDGVPLILRVYQVASACTDTVYVVTPWQERYQKLLPSSCLFIREVVCEDENNQTQSHGPLVGFAQALVHVNTEWALLLACDLPKLQVEILQAWIQELDSKREEAIAALVRHDQIGWEPLCGFYRHNCLTNLNKFINQGGRSFQQWLNQNPVDILPSPKMDMFFNCNKPDDLVM
ncbi:MAG: molybdenum cofactor guanylyltransferase [Calothrix sp. C42_A2020_038]|nr:molybdenum cofactor guanylyltransferase [Calothrix sp. C42_A2020_038]